MLAILFRIFVVVIGINVLAVLFFRSFLPLGTYFGGPDLTEKQKERRAAGCWIVLGIVFLA